MRDLPKHYNPHAVESAIYRRWEEGGYFRPDIHPEGEPFGIIMPPLNANERAHIGHALTMTVEDILIRHARMRGRSALWLPGVDHAGFETQVVYERKLQAEGKSRFDFAPEELYHNIWEYVQEQKRGIEEDVRRLGASCDWTRERFTLDPETVETVYATFKRLHADGLAYRGMRIVNYCTHHGTSFSDLEVEHVERSDPLYTVRYQLKDSDTYIEVATTRPETIPGDTAVAVDPGDERYRSLVGETAIVPIGGREVPVIADDAVDADFGTGAVKVTPAHDPLDFEIGERHRLPLVSVITAEGRLKETGTELDGLTVEEGRAIAVQLLGAALIKTEEITHSVGTCYKCGTVLEPLALEQWMVKMAPLAAPAMRAVEEGRVKFIPARFEKTFFQWMRGIRDWNISRQIVWGIPIPAWRCEGGHWTVTAGETPASCEECDSRVLVRDPDVFDTWFSSGQWPFSTLGYPDGADFKKFYPINPKADSIMETGYDILFFWVARMIMLGLYVTGEVPFQRVYLHGMVRDEKGAKISKSKGNVINPMEVIEKHGTDALRAGLILSSPPGRDSALSWSRIEEGQHFANKLWNVARFAFSRTGEAPEPTDADHMITDLLRDTITAVDKDIEKFRLDHALTRLYHFVWDVFADLYIEAAKDGFHQETMDRVLQDSLKLLHPFMPFITEEIWSHLGKERPLIISAWPDVREFPQTESAASRRFQSHIQQIRSERAASAVAEEKAGLEKYIVELQGRLANKDFRAKASADAVRAAEENLEAAEARLSELG